MLMMDALHMLKPIELLCPQEVFLLVLQVLPNYRALVFNAFNCTVWPVLF